MIIKVKWIPMYVAKLMQNYSGLDNITFTQKKGSPFGQYIIYGRSLFFYCEKLQLNNILNAFIINITRFSLVVSSYTISHHARIFSKFSMEKNVIKNSNGYIFLFPQLAAIEGKSRWDHGHDESEADKGKSYFFLLPLFSFSS